MATNSYYNPTGAPVQQTRGTSPSIRNEYALVAAGFALLPSPAAIAGGFGNYAVDTGSANAYAVTAGSAIIAYVDGLTLLVKAANGNTGASTINVNALGATAIVRQDGTALQANDILEGVIVQISYDATAGKFQISNNALAMANSAFASATTATTQAGLAAASAASAASYSASLQGTSTTSLLIAVASKALTTQLNRGWSTGQFLVAASAANNANYIHGQITSYDPATGALALNVLDVGGSGSFADWIITISGMRGPVGATGPIGVGIYTGRVPVTGNRTIFASDVGVWFDCVAVLTLTFDATFVASTSAFCRISAIGSSAEISIASSDGVTNWVMYADEVRDFYSDGTTVRSKVLQPFHKTFIASGSFIKPPGYTLFSGLLWAGGASGGKGGGSGQGAGGGACLPLTILASALSATATVTLGAGGVAQTSSGAAGNVGGNSIFAGGTSYGGGPGTPGTTSGGGGGLQSAGTITTGGKPYLLTGTGVDGNFDNAGFGGGTGTGSGKGGSSIYGGAAGGGGGNAGGDSVYGGAGGGAAGAIGGTSLFGGAGGAGNVSTSGVDGAAPGGGGGGTNTGPQSGAGARGELRIWGVI
ncbi:MAG: hypothetical protein V4505_00690 [Pseudomonadota bacterium]